ncbi:MAG: hypothetical protein LBS43_00105 [Prevotellaceae bacterium]|jgi:hypothetical protein|nr:hypothetical protein [Prevotellaceae bacterium]
MKANKDFRRYAGDSRGSEYVKGKSPLKEKKSKRSIYDEIEEDEDIGYSNFRKKESVEDYFDDGDYDDYEVEDVDDEFDFVDDEYNDYEDDEY